MPLTIDIEPPFACVPVPDFKLIAPPTEPDPLSINTLPPATEESPADTRTDPPSVVLLVPALTSILPEPPTEALPVVTDTDPLLPVVAFPLPSVTDPVSIALEADDIVTLPLSVPAPL